MLEPAVSSDALPVRQRHLAVLIGALTTMIVLCTGALRAPAYNNYVLLAQAFLEHHAWIDWPGPYIDALAWNGAHYIIEAPLPALLLMPAVAIFGASTNQAVLGALLCGLSLWAAWSFASRIGVSTGACLWLVVFLFAGTDLWWCASLGWVWFVAHVASVTMTMLALNELAGARRPWLVALYACAAIASRFSLVLALPVYAIMLLFNIRFSDHAANLTHPEAPTKPSSTVGFWALCAAYAAVWVLYNLQRWGVPYDIGYTAWYHQDSAGMPTGSPFQLRYLGYQLRSFFLSPPYFVKTFPWVLSSPKGISLTYTSPALLLALRAQQPQRAVIMMWLATFFVATPSFVYYVNGYDQFGMRHALDFEPFLWALMALGARSRLPGWGRALIFYSSAVGAWGVWYWHVLLRY